MTFLNYRKKRKRRWMTSGSGSHHHHHHSRHHHRRHSRGRRAAVIGVSILLVFCLLIGCGAGGFFYLRHTGKSSLQKSAASDAPNMDGQTGDVVVKNGKKYRYNKELINILCLGIDKTTEEMEGQPKVSGGSGQADAIVLVTLDPTAQTMKMTAIPRDTITEIETYDASGNSVGKSKNHLALAYAYGDGGKKSGELTVAAVSNLLYQLPIHGYAAIRMDAVEKLNDSVGGVTVTLPEEMQINGMTYEAGQSLTLTGSQALSYVRTRDIEAAGANLQRMERQKGYAVSFIQSAKQALKKNPTLAATLYQEITADMVTNIGLDEAVYLASMLPQMRFSAEDIQTVQGTIRQGKKYEEYYADEDALQALILDTFYTEAE